MKPDRVNCNHCGVRLEVAATTNFVTCGKCGTQLVVRRTGTSIYTERVEAKTEFTTPELSGALMTHSVEMSSRAPQGDLSELKRQTEINNLENQLNRLDMEWEREKQQYMVSDRNGNRRIPNKETSGSDEIFGAVFGTVWTIFAFGIVTGFEWRFKEIRGIPTIVRVLFPFLGVVMVILAIRSSRSAYNNAEQYEQANQRYQDRRNRLLHEIGKLRL